MVDKDGNNQFKGKQGCYHYDRQQTNLSQWQRNWQNYLKSLPASAIDQLEIMTNPFRKNMMLQAIQVSLILKQRKIKQRVLTEA